jgi:hypothetical protein
MKPYVALILGGMAVLLSGCATTSPEMLAPPAAATKTITWMLVSEPSGAEVSVKSPEGTKVLGQTPLEIPVGFAEQREPLFLGLTRHKKWHLFPPSGFDCEITEERDTATVSINNLVLRRSGYRDESLRIWQRFSPDLRQLRDQPDQRTPAPASLTERIWFQNPTEPQHTFRVRIDTDPSGGEIFARNKDGSMGKRIGALPFTDTIRIAEQRYLDGRHKDWIRFHDENSAIWDHGADGYLYLTCFLVKSGYEPEAFVQRRVCRYDRSSVWDGTEKVAYRMTKPTKAEWRFRLRMDSLPSGATVYAVADDGSIGRKLGETPLECEIGLAQSDYEEGQSGKYFHKDWQVWAPQGLIRWFTSNGGVGHLNLTCALFKDGFAVEKVAHEVCTLTPGKDFEMEKTVTIPLPTHQQAAIREQNQFQKDMFRKQQDWDEEMARRKRQWDQEVAARQAQAAQQAAAQQTIVVKNDPHYGQEWQTGMRALGEVIRPYSKVDPLTTEKNIRALEGYGTLLDLMNRK